MISKEVLERLVTKTREHTNERAVDLEFREMMIDSDCFFERPIIIVGIWLGKMAKATIYVGHIQFTEVFGQGYIPLAIPRFVEPDHYIEVCVWSDSADPSQYKWGLHVAGCPRKGHLLREYLHKKETT